MQQPPKVTRARTRQPLVDFAAERHLSYAVAHRLALTGQIQAMKQGGRWYVLADSNADLLSQAPLQEAPPSWALHRQAHAKASNCQGNRRPHEESR
jgi:hypothetical protein